MNILILSYASEPGAGSEYGVGWNVPVTMAKKYPEHEIYVATRSRCKEKIVEGLGYECSNVQEFKSSSLVDGINVPNLHFLFYDTPSWMFYKNEMKSHWGEQINYLLWQLLVRRFIRKQHKTIKFDVIHHLTFNQYRTPSPGFWMDIPFVMGPVGGAECIAPAFWQDLDEHTRKKEKIRSKGKDLKIFRWFNTRRKNNKIILCSSRENMERLNEYRGNADIRLMPAIGFSLDDFNITTSSVADDSFAKPFSMLYAGKAWDWKGIHIFLKAVAKAFSDNDSYKVKLIGIRFEEEQKRVMGWVEELKLSEHVELIPFIERSELLKMEAECDLSVYPAFRDSGSMSILEACALACPSICFDAGGQDIFPDDILLKVKVADTYSDCLDAFAERLLWAYNNRLQLKQLGSLSQKWVQQNLSWEKKVTDLMEVYASLTPNLSLIDS